MFKNLFGWKWWDLRKIVHILSGLLLLFNSLYAPLYVLAQEEVSQEPQTKQLSQTIEETAIPEPTPNIEPISTGSPTPIAEQSPTPNPSPLPSAEPLPSLMPEASPTPEPIPLPGPEPEPLVESPAPEIWSANDTGGYTTLGNVAVGVIYSFPQNSKVSITFRSLPLESGTLTIKEVKLTTEQQTATGAFSDTAYDITSSMEDGTFTYDLALPLPSGTTKDNLKVKYAENLDGITDVQDITQVQETTSDGLTVKSLDHMTIFVVVNSTPPPANHLQDRVDNSDLGFEELSGTWRTSTSVGGYYGSNYITTDNHSGVGQVRWNFASIQSGTQEVFTRWTSGSNRGTAVPFTVTYDGGAATVLVNQELNNGTWMSLGAYPFTAGSSYSVTLTNNSTNTSDFVVGDAIKLQTTSDPLVVYVDDDWSGMSAGSDVVVGSDTYYIGFNAFSKIQEGVNGVASDGTINVAAGTYTENIIVDKSLGIIGEDRATTFIDASGALTPGIDIQASNVSISGFTVSSTVDTTPYLVGAAGTIDAADLPLTGIELTDIIITGPGSTTTFTFGNQGFRAENIDTLTLTNIVISGMRDHAIDILDSTSVTIDNAQITAKDFSSWVGVGPEAIRIEDSSNVIVRNSVIDGGFIGVNFAYNPGTWDDSGTQGTIENNTIDHTWDAVLLADKADALVQYNILRTSNTGILIGFQDSDPNPPLSLTANIIDNTIMSNVRGIRVQNAHATETTINSNSITGNSEVGVKNFDSDDTLDAESNWWGTAVITEVESQLSGNVDFRPYYVDADKTILSPVIDSVSTTTADGSYGIGQNVTLTITFSEPVNVIGTPTITLNSGGIAYYSSGTGTDTLTLDYSIAGGENSDDLDYETDTSLDLNGGTIQDVEGNDATLTLPAVGTFSSTYDIEIDTTVPTNPDTPTTTTPTNNNTPTWDWADSFDINFDHYVFFWDTILGDEANSSGNIFDNLFTHPLPLDDGTWYTKVKAYDAAGNFSTSDNGSVLVDTTTPTLFDLTFISNNANSVYAREGDTVTLHFFSDEPIKPPAVIISGNVVAATNNLPDNGNEWTATYSLAAADTEGDIPFSINYVDAVDNPGSEVTNDTSGQNVFYDRTNPTDPTPMSTSHTTSTWDNDRTVNVTWNDADDPDGSGVDGFYTEWNTLTDSLNGPVSKEYEEDIDSETSPSLTSGQNHYFHIATVDNAGNWTSTEHLGPFWIDATNPSVSLTTPNNGDYLKGTVNLEATASDAHSGVEWVRFRYRPSGSTGSFTTIDTDTTSPYEASWDTTGVTDGDYTLSARARDNSGRTKNDNSTTVTIDNTLPTDPTDIETTSHLSPANDKTIDMVWTIAGIAPGATDATSGVDGYSYEFTQGAADIPDDTKDLEETEVGVTSGSLSDGSWYFHLRTTDNIGNWTSTIHAGPYVVDTTNPTGSWTSPLNGDTVSGIVSLEADASDIGGSGVTSVLFQYKKDDGIDTFDGISTDSDSPYSASWDTTLLDLDTYILEIVVTDEAGNQYTSDISVEVSAVVSAESGASSTYGSATITWTTDKETSSRIVYDTVSHGTLGAAPNYGYSSSTGTSDTSPKVTSHSVTITGLSNGVTYYYRTVSEGSPIAVGEEKSFQTLSTAGAGTPSGGGAVASTTTLGAATFFEPVVSFLTTLEEEEGLRQETKEVKEPTVSPEPSVKGAESDRGWLWWLLAIPALGVGYYFYRRLRKY